MLNEAGAGERHIRADKAENEKLHQAELCEKTDGGHNTLPCGLIVFSNNLMKNFPNKLKALLNAAATIQVTETEPKTPPTAPIGGGGVLRRIRN